MTNITENDAPRAIQNIEVIKKFASAVTGYEVKLMADKIHKSPSSVYAEIGETTDQRRAKQGLDDAIEMTKIHHDYGWIYELANIFGLTVIRTSTTPDGKNYHHELTQVSEAFSGFMLEATKPNPDKSLLLSFIPSITKEMTELITRVERGERG